MWQKKRKKEKNGSGNFHDLNYDLNFNKPPNED